MLINRLEGEDVTARRTELLAQLDGLVSRDELASLIPETSADIDEMIGLLALDADALFEELEAAAEQAERSSPRMISFAVLPEDEEAIEEAVGRAARGLDGPNRRGRALALICRAHNREGLRN